MKLSDYKKDLLRETMTSEIDERHDTVYGTFVKGAVCAIESQWIKDKNPEDFEEKELINCPLAVKSENGGHGIAARKTCNGKYVWDIIISDSEIDKVIAWKEVYV